MLRIRTGSLLYRWVHFWAVTIQEWWSDRINWYFGIYDFGTYPHMPRNLCQLLSTAVLYPLLLPIAMLQFALVGTVIAAIAGPFVAVYRLMAYGIRFSHWLTRRLAHFRRREQQHTELPQTVDTWGALRAYVRARKRKVCPLVEYVD